MSELLSLQVKFSQLVAKLILYINETGYQCTLGEAYRTPEQAAIDVQKHTGILHSEHCNRLAIDLDLFQGGIYLTDSAAYEIFGDYWKTLDPLARWGGDFSKPDGNHFSLEFQGVS